MFKNPTSFEQSILSDTGCRFIENNHQLIIAYQTQRYHISYLLEALMFAAQQQALQHLFNNDLAAAFICNYSEGDPTLDGIEQTFTGYGITCRIITA